MSTHNMIKFQSVQDLLRDRNLNQINFCHPHASISIILSQCSCPQTPLTLPSLCSHPDVTVLTLPS